MLYYSKELTRRGEVVKAGGGVGGVGDASVVENANYVVSFL